MELDGADKRAGGRAWYPQQNLKRGGARAFARQMRGGGRAWYPQSMDKRAGGRAFYGGGGYNFGSLYSPTYYEKKAAYFPYLTSEFKRGGGRAFQWYVIGDGKSAQQKRAGGRSFPIEESVESLVNQLHR
ncbi:hypothetical protein M3Y99_00404200 [Aphelenchoides fujianensis]|nr:hypothetical protein M3Y99_00404200 [Aphelenchoides fujianensis]